MCALSTSIQRMSREYDAIVVGSGYGGAVIASRLARAGRRVCLLERGREHRLGEFPETPADAMTAIQTDWPDRHVGSATALFDFRMNQDISVLAGCGLGGTSLINANVAIDPDPRVWQDAGWPEALRADVDAGVAQGFSRAREMLRPLAFPSDLPRPTKLAALEKSAAHMGARCIRPPIVVNFADRVNHVGVAQQACNSCGNCVGGCNVGAKNTLMTNYLPDARNHGAHIFSGAKARWIERRGTQWLVHFDLMEAGPRRFGAPTMFVAADLLVLSAGSLGSTEILLRSRDRGLTVSDRLGHGFTGNGDVVAFAYNTDIPVGGLADPGRKSRLAPGPTITGLIDLRDTERLEDGMVIQEGVIPSSLQMFLATSLALTARAIGQDTDAGLRDYASEKAREIQAMVPGGSPGATAHTLTFLVMSHDDSSGHMNLVDDRLRISWPAAGRQAIFEKVDGRLHQATEALGGTYIRNPIWADRLGKGLITVHPLGGCGMADSAEYGVVDDRGRVFDGRAGSSVHDGLYVCDGAGIPQCIGINPLLTITALAERTAALIAQDHGWEIPCDLPARQPAPARRKPLRIRFTETMRGHICTEACPDHASAAARGREENSRLEFTVTVISDDLETMLSDPDHVAGLYGTVFAPALSPEPLTVTEGTFNLFTVDPLDTSTRRMTYRMPLEAPDGTRYHLHGYKLVHDGPGFDVWDDTTTLYVTVYRERADVIAAQGILRIKPRDFSKQLRTFEVTNARSTQQRLDALASFGRFFVGSLYDTHGPGRRRGRGSAPTDS